MKFLNIILIVVRKVNIVCIKGNCKYFFLIKGINNKFVKLFLIVRLSLK